MFVRHPVYLGISLITAILYHIYLKGRKALRFTVMVTVPVFLFSAIFNLLFNHEGATILAYFPDGNPLTKESILFGIAAGIMMLTVMNWFACFHEVMTSDKFIYLFGRLIPGISLVLSMILRFIPKYEIQIKKVSNAQKCIGRDVSDGNIREKAMHGMKILSIMVTWALENSVETADSMRSRGYGLRGRTSFSIYRFDARDKIMLAVISISGMAAATGVLTGQVSSLYYPVFSVNPLTAGTLVIYGAFLFLCLMPIFINLWEDKKWDYLQSRI